MATSKNKGVSATVTDNDIGSSNVPVLSITKNGMTHSVSLPETGEDAFYTFPGLSGAGYYVAQPNVAVGADKTLVVYFGLRSEESGVHAQFYSFDAQPIGSEFYLSTQVVEGDRPGVAAFSDGRYIVVWQTNNPEGYPNLGDRIQYVVGRVIEKNGTLDDTFIIATGVNLLVEGTTPQISFSNGKVSVSWDSYSTLSDLSGRNSGEIGDINQLINGSNSNDDIYGFGGDDTINGLNGDDSLDGGIGNDTINGGNGNDLVTSGDGNDIVKAGSGSDVIVGGTGAGNDKYDGGSGIDLVKYLSAISGISVDLSKTKNNAYSTDGNDAAGIGIDSLKNIEDVVASNYDDIIIGSGSANSLNGENGNDIIRGGKGNDLLIGGEGIDYFVFDTALNKSSNIDTIEDFEIGADKIYLENAIFKKFTTQGVILESNLIFGDRALATDDYLIYNNGTVYYDADGSGSGKAIPFVSLVGSPDLSVIDFQVI